MQGYIMGCSTKLNARDVKTPVVEKSTKFYSESDLVEILIQKHFDYTLVERKGVVTEFECNHGIADISEFSLRSNWRDLLAIGRVNPTWVYALKVMPYRKRFDTNAFSEIAGVSTQYARKALNSYKEAGFCIKSDLNSDSWYKIYQPRKITTRIFSYEAKLKNWRRALIQANRYKDFSDKSFVVLDEHYIKPAASNIQAFIDLNVGLCSISSIGKKTVYYEPLKEPPRSEVATWIANSKIAALACSLHRFNNT